MPVQDKLIKLVMTLAVVIVATLAAIISYRHAYSVALRWGGEDRFAATILPITIDGMIAVGSLTGLFCSRYSLAPPKLARTALYVGIAATLAMNVAHGLAYSLIAAVIGGWPAVAFLVSSELLLWVVGASRTLDRRTTVIVEHTEEERDPHLERAIEMLGENSKLSAAALGRSLGLSYPKALDLAKQARRALVTTTF